MFSFERDVLVEWTQEFSLSRGRTQQWQSFGRSVCQSVCWWEISFLSELQEFYL